MIGLATGRTQGVRERRDQRLQPCFCLENGWMRRKVARNSKNYAPFGILLYIL